MLLKKESFKIFQELISQQGQSTVTELKTVLNQMMTNNVKTKYAG